MLALLVCSLAFRDGKANGDISDGKDARVAVDASGRLEVAPSGLLDGAKYSLLDAPPVSTLFNGGLKPASNVASLAELRAVSVDAEGHVAEGHVSEASSIHRVRPGLWHLEPKAVGTQFRSTQERHALGGESMGPAIAKNIFLTTKTSDLTEQEAKFMTSWQDLNPTYGVQFFNDTAAENMMRTAFPDKPDVFRVYKTLPLPVMKADMWRYAVLFLFGGVYADMDMLDVKPMDELLGSDGKCTNVLLFENANEFTFSQAFLAGAKGSPLFQKALDLILENVLKDGGVDFKKHGAKSVHHYTGPNIWTQAVSAVAGSPNCPYSKANGHAQWEDVAQFFDVACIAKSAGFKEAGCCMPAPADLASKANFEADGTFIFHAHGYSHTPGGVDKEKGYQVDRWTKFIDNPDYVDKFFPLAE